MTASASFFPTLSGHILPRLFAGHPITRQVFLVLAGSAFIALLAQFVIPLPYTPVPITGQTLAVLLVGMALGSRLGALAAVAYCIEGIWLPVFAGGATWAHPGTLFTGGYLIGFIGGAYVAGWLAERGWDRNMFKTALAMLIGNVVIYIPGLLWLGFMLSPASVGEVLYKGAVLFLVGDAFKIMLAMVLFPSLWRLINRS